jgi:protein transport protein SEC13
VETGFFKFTILTSAGNWAKIDLKSEGFGDVVWRVSWSPCGNLLAVSCGDNKVTVWKENMDGQWSLVGDVTES